MSEYISELKLLIDMARNKPHITKGCNESSWTFSNGINISLSDIVQVKNNRIYISYGFILMSVTYIISVENISSTDEKIDMLVKHKIEYVENKDNWEHYISDKDEIELFLLSYELFYINAYVYDKFVEMFNIEQKIKHGKLYEYSWWNCKNHICHRESDRDHINDLVSSDYETYINNLFKSHKSARSH